MTEDITWNIVGASVVRDKKLVIGYSNKMLSEMANATLNNTNYIEGNNFIAVQGYCNYVEQYNEPCKVEYCDVYRFPDNKLAEITSYCIEVK